MSDKDILSIVRDFRREILHGGSPLKMCFAVCAPIEGYLQFGGVQVKLTEGSVNLTGHNEGISINHFWLTLEDGRIIDPTISQFNGMGHKRMPAVYLGEKPEWFLAKREE